MLCERVRLLEMGEGAGLQGQRGIGEAYGTLFFPALPPRELVCDFAYHNTVARRSLEGQGLTLRYLQLFMPLHGIFQFMPHGRSRRWGGIAAAPRASGAHFFALSDSVRAS